MPLRPFRSSPARYFSLVGRQDNSSIADNIPSIPLVAVLLFLRPRAGVVITVAIMVSDVAHNVWAVTAMGAMVWPVVAQGAFLAFVTGTAPMVWRDLSAPSRD